MNTNYNRVIDKVFLLGRGMSIPELTEEELKYTKKY